MYNIIAFKYYFCVSIFFLINKLILWKNLCLINKIMEAIKKNIICRTRKKVYMQDVTKSMSPDQLQADTTSLDTNSQPNNGS